MSRKACLKNSKYVKAAILAAAMAMTAAAPVKAEESELYIVFMPTTGNVSYTYDEEHVSDAYSTDDYTILLYNEGDQVEIKVDTAQDVSVYDTQNDNELVSPEEIKDGQISFTMPGSDIELKVEEGHEDESAEEIPDDTDEAEEPAQEEEPVQHETEGTVSVDALNVRSAPNADSEKLTVLSNGDTVKITGQAENGWLQIALDGTDTPAYVKGEYVSYNPDEIGENNEAPDVNDAAIAEEAVQDQGESEEQPAQEETDAGESTDAAEAETDVPQTEETEEITTEHVVASILTQDTEAEETEAPKETVETEEAESAEETEEMTEAVSERITELILGSSMEETNEAEDASMLTENEEGISEGADALSVTPLASDLGDKEITISMETETEEEPVQTEAVSETEIWTEAPVVTGLLINGTEERPTEVYETEEFIPQEDFVVTGGDELDDLLTESGSEPLSETLVGHTEEQAVTGALMVSISPEMFDEGQSPEVTATKGDKTETASVSDAGTAEFPSLPEGIWNVSVDKARISPLYEDPEDVEVEVGKEKAEVTIEAELVTRPVRITAAAEDGGMPLKGASFGIYAEDGTTVGDKAVTDENGSALVTLQAGDYILRQETAPETFEKSEDVAFSVSKADPKDGIDIEVKNAVAVKTIAVKVAAEDGSPAAGHTVGIFAEEDIKNLAGENVYTAGDMVGETTTDADGNASFEVSYPGNYNVKETSVPEGEYVIIDEDGQSVSITEEGTQFDIQLENVKTSVNVSVKDENGAAVEGVTLSMTTPDGQAAGTVSSEGSLVHITDIKPGYTYSLKAENLPDGYIADAEEFNIKVDPSGMIDGSASAAYDFILAQIKAEAGCIDEATGAAIPGVKMSIKDAGGAVVKEWTSGNMAEEINGIAPGTYTISAESAPNGYEEVQPVSFTVNASKEKQASSLTLTPQRQVKVITNDKKNGKPISGFEYELLDSEGKAVTRYSEENAWVKVSSGNYTLHQVSSKPGYVTMPDKDITIEKVTRNNAGIQEVEVTAENVTVTISATGESGELLSGTKFCVKDKNGRELKEFVLGSEQTVIEKIPAGEYILSEISVPDGYVPAGETQIMVENKGDVQTFNIQNTATTLQVHDVNYDDGTPVEGTVLSVVDEKGNVVDTWKSDGKAHTIRKIKEGLYTLMQTTPASGYKVLEGKKFNVANTASIQTVTMHETRSGNPVAEALASLAKGDRKNMLGAIAVSMFALCLIAWNYVIDRVRFKKILKKSRRK